MTILPVVTVLIDSFSRSRCRHCRAAIVWYRTAGGSWCGFNGRPKVDRVRRDLTLASAPSVGDIARSELHWRSCPANNRINGQP